MHKMYYDFMNGILRGILFIMHGDDIKFYCVVLKDDRHSRQLDQLKLESFLLL